MRALVLLLILPLLALSQNTTGGNSSTDNSGGSSIITTTLLSTSIGLGQNRETVTSVISSVFTTIVAPSPTGNTTAGNSTNSTSTSSTRTSTQILPTAPTDVDGGGGGGAPVPGQSSPNGVYGPGDGYIAAATALVANAIAGCLLASGIAAALLIG